MSRRAYRKSASTPIPAMPPPWRRFSKLATACPGSSITCAEAVARHLVPDGLVTMPQERPGERRFTYCDRRVIWGTHAPVVHPQALGCCRIWQVLLERKSI
jgi:hypothetical protein